MDLAIEEILEYVNTRFWYVALVALTGVGLYVLIKFRAAQVVQLKESVRLCAAGIFQKVDKDKLSSFETFAISMGTRVGVGNIAGVATAIATGGPGAVFWMWLFAVLGAGTSFFESTLAQIYKVKKRDGSYYGGPAYYAMKGLKSKKAGAVMALMIILIGFCFVGVEASHCSAALSSAFGVDPVIVGLDIVLLGGIMIFSGTKVIGRFTVGIVPLMCILWFIFTGLVIILNIGNLGNTIVMIFEYAFTVPSLIGGGLGAIVMAGMRRGIFSSEAGLGTLVNTAATADVAHPVDHALLQSFGVLLDTLVICSCTAFAILSFGDWQAICDVIYQGGALVLTGAPFMQFVVANALGDWAASAVALFMFVFAFTSMIGYYTMSESNVRFFGDNTKILAAFRMLIVAVVFSACFLDTLMMDMISDTLMAVLGVINVIVILLLSGRVMDAYRDYTEQKKSGVKDPVFHRSSIRDNSGITEWGDD